MLQNLPSAAAVIGALKVNILPVFVPCCFFSSKSTFSKNSLRNTIRLSNRLDPDQTRRFARPDMGPNYFSKVINRLHE